MPTTVTYQELSLEQQVQRVRDAWYAKSDRIPGADPGWPLYVYADRIIIEHTDGIFSVPYTVDDAGLVTFAEPQLVDFVAASAPNGSEPSPADRRGLSAVAHDFIRTTGRLLGLADDEAPAQSAPQALANNASEGLLLEAPFRVYSEDDEERYVGGLVLTPGTDNAFGDLWDAKDIRLMAYRFMEQSRHIDLMHTTKVVAAPVESYYFPTEDEGGQAEYSVYGETVPGGSWWLGSRVQDDKAWEMVKSGTLQGYSMFAVKVEQQENRGYADPGQAPGGLHITADEWSITMVSLVDKPAVNKATYVIMRRAPDGTQVLTPKETTGEDRTMKNFRRIAAYHDDQVPPADANANATEMAGTTPADPAVADPNAPEVAGTTPADAADAADTPAAAEEALTREGILAMVGEAVDERVASLLTERLPALIDTGMAPLRQSLLALETRQARFTGSGALPVSRAVSNGGEEPQHPDSWVNFGTGPKTVEASANGHKS